MFTAFERFENMKARIGFDHITICASLQGKHRFISLEVKQVTTRNPA